MRNNPGWSSLVGQFRKQQPESCRKFDIIKTNKVVCCGMYNFSKEIEDEKIFNLYIIHIYLIKYIL